MATIANIFTLKLENKDFNAQLQTAAKSSQDYNNKIANSLLEAAKQEAKLVKLLKEKSELQAQGSKAAVTLKNQEIAATKSLIQAENASIKQAERNIAIQVEGAKRIIDADKAVMQSKQELNKVGELRAGFINSYVNTPAQNKFNASMSELNSLKKKGVISETEYTTALKKSNDALREGAPERDNQFNHMIRMMRWAGTLTAAFYGVKTAWDVTIGAGIELNRVYESQSLGLAAILASKTKMVEANGKEVEGVGKLQAAQLVMGETMGKIKEAATKTPATFSQMVGFYQQAIGHALSAGKSFGKNLTEISDNTIKLTQRMSLLGSAVGMPMDRINEEIRSLMSGNASTDSLLASLLFGSPSAANNAIKEAKKRTDGLTNLFDGVLKDVDSLMNENTFDMLKNNLISTFETIQKAGAAPIFEDFKTSFAELDSYLKVHSEDISNTVNIMYTQMKVGAVSVGEAVGQSVSVASDFLGALVGVAIDSVDSMNEAYRKINLGDIIVLGVTTGIEGMRNLVDIAALMVTEIGSLFNGLGQGITSTFSQINKGGAWMAGTFGSQKDAESFKQGADYWNRKTSDLKKDAKAFDQAVSGILKDMTDTDNRLAQAYNSLLLKGQPKAKDANRKKLEDALGKLQLINTPKTTEELEKERKKREAELAKQNREEVKAYELKKSLIEAEMAMQGRQTVEAEVRTKVDQNALRDKFALEFKLQDIRKERFDAEVATAKSELSDENTRRNKIAVLVKAYETDRKEFMTWELTQQDKINAEREKGYQDAAKAAYLLFDRQTAVAQRGLNNQDRGFDFTQAFGKNKVGIEEYQGAISSLITEADRAGDAMRTAFIENGLFSEESQAKLQADLDKLDNTLMSKVDHWRDRLAKIPDIELNMKVTGVDNVTNALATVVNSFSEMERSNKKLVTYSAEFDKRKKAGLDTAEDELKLSKLTLQNNHDQIATYQAIAGAVSGVFQQGSKEAAAFMIVQQGLAMVNAVNAVAVASASSPWTGLATGAAMVAFLAPMLANIGVVLGMNKVTTTSDAFSAMAANEGKGSVLGDSETGSESISKSMEIMADLAKPQFRLTSQMAKSLESIDSKIGGMTSLLLRQGGFAMGEGYEGFDTGMQLSSSKQLMGELFVGGTVGQTFKALDPILKGIPIIGDINRMMGGLVSGIGSFIGGGLFGKTSVSQTMADSGIYFADALLQNAIDTFEGSAYQTIATTVSKKSWFSKSSSTSISTYFAGLNDEVERQFSLVLSGLYDTTLLAGQALDTASSDIETNLSDFVVRIGKISLKGKTGDQIQETLSNIFGKIADDIALEVFPALIPFQKVGEALFETMTRVAGGMEEAEYYISRLGLAFNDVVYSDLVNKQGDVALEALRQSILALEGTSGGVSEIIQGLSGDVGTLYDTYASLDRLRFSLTAIGTASEGLTSSMLYGAGGIDALGEATQSYIDNFLTESEQVAYQASLMSDAFGDLGLTIPTTKQGFTELLKSIDVSTEGGQELYGRLILLSTGFSDLSDSMTAAFSDITAQAQSLSDAFSSMSNSIQDTIDKLLSTASGSSQSAMIGAFWDKRAQADVLLAKRGDLTVKEQQMLQSLVNDIDSLAINIQGAQVGSTGSITSSLVGQLQDLKSSVDLDNAIVQSRILDANGQVTDVATEGTLTRLADAMAERNALLGIDGSHAGGLAYVPYDGYVAQLHKGERVLTAAEANGFGGRTVVSFDSSVLEAINNKIYGRINLIYGILNDAQLGVRPLYVRS